MSVSDDGKAVAPARGAARDEILDGAKRLFAERGYDGVSISDIARETGVSKANIFHHFESKDGLYLAVIAAIVEGTPDRTPFLRGDGDVVARFEEMAAAEMVEAERDERGVRLILKELVSGSPLRNRVLAEDIFADRFAKLVAEIRTLQAEGRLRADIDPALAATVLRSATAFYVLGRDVLRHLPGVAFADDPEAYARAAARLVLRGLAAPETGGER